MEQNIDHIVLPESFNVNSELVVINMNKKLSDHIGICVEVV